MELLGYGYAAAVTIGGIIGYVKKGVYACFVLDHVDLMTPVKS